MEAFSLFWMTMLNANTFPPPIPRPTSTMVNSNEEQFLFYINTKLDIYWNKLSYRISYAWFGPLMLEILGFKVLDRLFGEPLWHCWMIYCFKNICFLIGAFHRNRLENLGYTVVVMVVGKADSTSDPQVYQTLASSLQYFFRTDTYTELQVSLYEFAGSALCRAQKTTKHRKQSFSFVNPLQFY